tara:strand:- start:634 stop:1485 length:852 start_codon:yes stop_codon:yes gene_type:complete
LARNNQRRAKAAPVEEEKQETVTPAVSPLSFVTPTEFVDLPSQGRLYGPSHPLHGKDTLEIRFMTARDEDILTSQTLLKKGVAIEKFLSNIIVDKTVQPNRLLVGDRNAILVAARITGYGETYETNITCPACNTKATFPFNLKTTKMYHGDDHEDYNITDMGDGTFLVDLPLTKVQAQVKILNGSDEAEITQMVDRNRRRTSIEGNLTAQFSKSIISLNGDDDKNTIQQFIEMMPAYDSRYLRGAYRCLTPDIDLSQDFNCSNCGHEQVMGVPFTADFFWPNR